MDTKKQEDKKMFRFHSMDGGVQEVEIPSMDSDEYKLQKQADLLALGLLQEKNKVADLLAALRPFANFACDDWETHKCMNCIAKQAIAKAEPN